MAGEGLDAVEVEPAGQAGDARQDVERGDVEVGTLAPPGLDDAVDVVGRGRGCSDASALMVTTLPSVKYLDIKII